MGRVTYRDHRAFELVLFVAGVVVFAVSLVLLGHLAAWATAALASLR